MGIPRGLLAALLLGAPGIEALGDEPVPRNVRIVVTATSDRTARRQGVEASGGVVVRGGASRSRSRDETRQELLVMSGGRGEIVVGEEVPYLDWFQVWGQGYGLWQPGIQWKEVGARMVVEPTVLDEDTLRVRLTPAFSYLVDRRSLTTEVTRLTTEVVVREGEEIDLGGIPFSDRQFLERFLVGFDESGETARLRITLRASIE
jgi:Bacterial type II and III secretion system protein